jgi:acetyltransferase-like isoleucine patch superfamily enzyme
MVNQIVKIFHSLRQRNMVRRNQALVDHCGAGAELRGAIEKRHPKSFVSVGATSRIDGYIVTEIATSRVTVGKNSLLGPRSIIDCVSSVTVGDDVLISYDCILADADNHSLSYSKRKHDLDRWRSGTHEWSDVKSAAIVIQNGAMIGARAVILKGVTVGEGAVVGMGSVVIRDVAPYTVVLGNPARPIMEIPPDQR